jgi:hypothetical protein
LLDTNKEPSEVANLGETAQSSVERPVPRLERPLNPIRAELVGATTAMACGKTAIGSSPVLDLCRELVAAGHNPATPLEAYRNQTLCLTVRSIGEAAGLEINGKGIGFRLRSRPPI